MKKILLTVCTLGIYLLVQKMKNKDSAATPASVAPIAPTEAPAPTDTSSPATETTQPTPVSSEPSVSDSSEPAPQETASASVDSSVVQPLAQDSSTESETPAVSSPEDPTQTPPASV